MHPVSCALLSALYVYTASDFMINVAYLLLNYLLLYSLLVGIGPCCFFFTKPLFINTWVILYNTLVLMWRWRDLEFRCLVPRSPSQRLMCLSNQRLRNVIKREVWLHWIHNAYKYFVIIIIVIAIVIIILLYCNYDYSYHH